MKHPGDPTPRSATSVVADRAYKKVVEQNSGIGGHPMTTIVVFHCGTESYWETTFPTAQAYLAVTWQHVEPIVETRTTYKPCRD